MKPDKKRKRADHRGTTFDNFLEQEGIREEVDAVAIRRVLAWQAEETIRKQQNTKRR